MVLNSKQLEVVLNALNFQAWGIERRLRYNVESKEVINELHNKHLELCLLINVIVAHNENLQNSMPDEL